MKLEFKVNMRIRKPLAEVFDAVVEPKKLSGYFTSSSTGPLREGGQVIWRFAEFPIDVPVTVRKVVPNKLIQLEWASDEGYNTHIEMKFEPIDTHTTLVSIGESGWRETEKGLKNSYGNCGGWMHMLCCLKGYLENGINLREGAFDQADFQ